MLGLSPAAAMESGVPGKPVHETTTWHGAS